MNNGAHRVSGKEREPSQEYVVPRARADKPQSAPCRTLQLSGSSRSTQTV